jgi:hypothetical protein
LFFLLAALGLGATDQPARTTFSERAAITP